MASLNYILGIDGLRALSVIAVIFYHLKAAWLPGGFAGVDVFFVISGYVVAGSLYRERNKPFREFTLGFYSRRLLRLYPALLVCGLIVSLLSVLFIPQAWLSQALRKTATMAFMGMSNFALIWFNDGYFSPRVEFNPFTHTWSLAVEEQFYLVFPLLFWLVLKYPRRMVALLAVLTVASLEIARQEMVRRPTWAFYLLPSRFWEIASGALLFQLHAAGRGLPRNGLIRAAALNLGLAAMGAGFVYCQPKGMPYPWALLPVAGALLALNAFAGQTEVRPLGLRVLESAPLVYLGKLSYSLYLWHWPVFVLFRWTVGLETGPQRVVALLLSVGLSLLSYHFVETPLRRSPGLLAWPALKRIVVGLGVVAASAGLAAILFINWDRLSLSVTRDLTDWHPAIFPEVSAESAKGRFARRQLFMVGDSHVGAYGTLVKRLVDQDGVRAIRIEKEGCTVFDLLTPLRRECVDFVHDTVESIVRQAHPGDVVFFAALRMYRLVFNFSLVPSAEVRAQYGQIDGQRAQVLAEASPVFAKLIAAGLHVVVDAPKPVLPAPPFRCSDDFNRHNPICRGGLSLAFETFERMSQPVRETLKQLQAQNPALLIWDPALILCGMKTCDAFEEEKPLFFDGDHISGYANTLLYPSFTGVLQHFWRN